MIGLPLFGVLTPQRRVAVLGHEFGHFVNGDPARGLLTRPALRTPSILANLVRPSESFVSDSLWGQLAERALWPFQVLLQRLFALIGTGAVAVAARDHQRAEYCADALSVRLAGTAATEALMLDFAAADAWRAAVNVDEVLEKSVTEEASLWRDHPPSGLRARIVQSWPHTGPPVVLSEADSAKIDAELHRCYARAGRDMAWSAA